MTESHPGRGILLIAGALFLFAALDTTAKFLTQSFAVGLIVWARYLVHCLLMLVFLGPRLGWRLVATRRPLRQIVRALMLLGCTAFGIAGLRLMPLAETTAVFFISPLLVAALAGPFLGERPHAGVWLALVAGFSGVLLIARPGGVIVPEGIAFTLSSAACYVIYQILTRQLAASDKTTTMVFYTALVGTLGSSMALPWLSIGIDATPLQLAQLASLGILGGCGHWLLTRAFRHARASTLAPYFYLQLVWATLFGALVFGHWPDALSFVGMAVIVGSGLALGLRDRYVHTRIDG